MYSAIAVMPLTAAEEDALDSFGRWAASMELLGGLNEWQQGDRGPETDLLHRPRDRRPARLRVARPLPPSSLPFLRRASPLTPE